MFLSLDKYQEVLEHLITISTLTGTHFVLLGGEAITVKCVAQGHIHNFTDYTCMHGFDLGRGLR